MRELIDRALDTARQQGASYADARVVRRRVEHITVKNGIVEAITSDETLGIGVRVVADGAWGFASTDVLNGPAIDVIAGQAVAIARASALAQVTPLQLGAPVATVGTYRTPYQRDPLEVPLNEKVDLLLAACQAMQRVPGIAVAEAGTEVLREEKWFGSTEGAWIEQEIIESGCGIEATAVTEGEVQNRSYPNSVGRQQGTAGWEFVERWDLAGNAERIASEAVALLTAEPCPAGETTLILDGSQTALQVHESCGHPIELDRVLGMEASFAGTSFLTTDKLGAFRYGSDAVTIVADATVPGGLGTFGFDDEGVPAQRTTIVDRGDFVGYLTSRETASLLGQPSNGTMRADNWNRIPLIRMTNINLEPGSAGSLADLIADTDDGIYMQTNRSWSIDDRRLNFQFGTEIAWEIKGGKLGRMLKNPTYTGITPQFWGSCDAVCGPEEWTVWGTPNCGKGQPEQVAHVGHGAAPARFRKVRVGVMQ
jgi:TldD protein